MSQLTCTGAGRSAAAAGYTFPLLTLFGGVERLAASGDYSLTCGTGAETLPVEFVNNAGNVTISADTNWGNATADERLLAVRVRGNLTIDATKTLTAAARKLGLLIFCDGDVTVNGTLSMTARGANHSATGSNLTAFDIMLYEVSAAADNILPAAGGSGAASPGNNLNGITGSAGANGGTGGGGSGGVRESTSKPSGSGAAGTGYSGGPGGGGIGYDANGVTSGADRGGAGGIGNTMDGGIGGGGAGNPGGIGGVGNVPNATYSGLPGTGGIVLIYASGAIAINAGGIVSANGANAWRRTSGYIANLSGGGGSGGGSVSIYYHDSYSNSGSITASGGLRGIADTGKWGGDGGAGSIRVVAV